MWQELLRREGIPAVVEPVISFLGLSPSPHRLLVLEGRDREAKAVLKEYLGDDAF